jgi:electron transfer flavoprotein alpha subunit
MLRFLDIRRSLFYLEVLKPLLVQKDGKHSNQELGGKHTMKGYSGVMVYCEVGEGGLLSISMELLGGGRKLADELGETLRALLLGSGVSGLAKEAIVYGADQVMVVDDPLLKEFDSDIYLSAMKAVVEEDMPRIILMGHTGAGRDLAPRLAFRLDTAASLNCIDLAIDSESRRLLQTRQVYGGNVQAVFTIESDPQIVTVRPKSISPMERNEDRVGELRNIDAGLAASVRKSRVVDRFEEELAGIKLEDADVIVAGGRGMGGPDGFKQLEALAAQLKGTVGASRPPCDEGWVPTGLQIGITGKTVTPELYIAVGISGAPQHICGANGSKYIVAINKDPDSNIFKEAHFGVVGDWKKVLPSISGKLRALFEE